MFRTGLVILMASVLGACGDDDNPAVDGGDLPADAGGGGDAGEGDIDSGMAADGGAGDGGADGAAVQAYCEARAMYDERCGETPQPVAECVADSDVLCLVSLVRPDALPGHTTCLRERECGTSDDICATPEGAGYEPSAAAIAFGERCMTVRTECGGGFSDDLCFALPARDEVVAELDACLDTGCENIGACVITIFTCG